MALLASAACSNKPATSAAASNSDALAGATAEGKDPALANVEVGPRIAEACGISASEAYFAYNSSRLSESAGSLISRLATCFTTGPLAGRTMSLVGHTDPRGEEEYNLVLGGRRADNVASALVGQGLPEAQTQTTSRGELEARGTDEASWAKDRRVEILLVD